MAIDPPYRIDPFQNIINVHWEETTTGEGGFGPRLMPIGVGVEWFAAFTMNASGPRNGSDVGGYMGIFGTWSGCPDYTSDENSAHGPVDTPFENFDVSFGSLSVTFQITSGSLYGPYSVDYSGCTFTEQAPYTGIWHPSSIEGPFTHGGNNLTIPRTNFYGAYLKMIRSV